MAFKRGLVQTPTQTTSAPPAVHTQVRGRVVDTKPQPRQPQRQEPSRIIMPNQSAPPIYRGLVNAQGQSFTRGLQPQTVTERNTQAVAGSEKCPRCGEDRPSNLMKTLIPNAENSGNPLRICADCASKAYKDPHNQQERWRPEVPNVRFDRESGQPYNARRSGVTIKDLTTKDTYHRENEVDPEFRPDRLHNEGQWSGGGRKGHTVRKRR